MHKSLTIAVALLGIATLTPNASAQYDSAARERARARSAAVQAARGEQARAQLRVQTARQKVQASWDAAPQLADAENAAEAARAAFEEARKPVIDKLKGNPDYAKALREEKEAQAKIAAERGEATPSTQPTDDDPAATPDRPRVTVRTEPNEPTASEPASGEQIQAAAEKLNQRTKRRDMEDKAVEADPAAMAAKTKLDEAQEAVKRLNDQLEAALRNDPEYKAAVEDLANAKARVLQAASQH